MIPTVNEIKKLHKRYAQSEAAFKQVFDHCQIVAEISLWAADRTVEPVDKEILNAAALLHDIGTYLFFDEEGNSSPSRFYPQHSILGAKIVQDEGCDPRIAGLIETHVLLGLTKQEIITKAFPLPARDYTPKTLEGEILCYADRFHSKKPQFNSFETFMKRLKNNLPHQAEKFQKMSEQYGLPDIDELAARYGHPIV